ncbi:RNA-binding protein [Mesorhizobium sp. SEMIA 3007]|jgi:ribosome-associated heat shock protein Hsp15|uniref:RNA-binding S4 domain-containing protein n=1 Tax=Mesorhizobium jarvisii TaxID=1777867 RepID=A0A6M7TEV1_9HYPH|nr:MULTISPECIES: RNA-binding S4 domain-containing protein [Mesorhizobium]AID32987.1 RNA-binding S4 domain-containing protein [Mesorhizobium huakuii 7653R]ANN56479.1 RNA-binding protein [Mesorhizobium loti NZP2037]MCH4557300.1 RNA-binding S4 domain-containing protein [Mesorhizobium jarvisii]OBQ76591.1 RNA-binding protein [Mesorhizobium loti]ODA91728.1 RNA-binding protein [Mesorhizobium sp. SEMIA 3007]
MVAEGRQRIDKWLFFSRAVKSRSLAAKLVVAGRVRINRDKAAQASDLVKPGDVLTITLDRRIFVWKVLGAGVRRGPAEEARTLYEDMSPPPTPKGEALPDAIPALREAGSGRPTKRERRQTDRLLGDD